MKIAVLLLMAFVALQSSAGQVPGNCLNCICTIENNCNTGSCNWDAGSISCGPFQIKEPYYNDAVEYNPALDSGWQSCTKQMVCSRSIVQAYMARYATVGRLGTQPTCEHFARIHNGGPNGYWRSSTIGYWNRVNQCLTG